jgi:hypothetical protein
MEGKLPFVGKDLVVHVCVHVRFPGIRYSSRIVYGSGLTAAELTSSLVARVQNFLTGEVFRWLLLPKIHNAVADALQHACQVRLCHTATMLNELSRVCDAPNMVE